MKAIWRDVISVYSKALAKPVVHAGELLSVQRLRGVAVLMVLLVHIEDVARKLPGWADFHSAYALNIGYSAPDMFFVISGFIMTYITFTTPFKPRRWLISRFIRIFPMFFFFTSLVVVLWLFNPAMTMGSGEHDWWSVTQSLLILPQADLPILFVGWTLEHELVFYATVFLVARFLTYKWLTSVLVLMSVLAFAKWLLREYSGVDFWDFHILSLYIAQFAMGACIYRFWSTSSYSGWVLPCLLGVVLVAVAAVVADSGTINREQPLRVLLFGGAYSMLLLALLSREKCICASGRMPSKRDGLVRAGDASYSIYLSHIFVLACFGKIFPYLELSQALGWLVVLGTGLTTLLVGQITHVFIEKPIIEVGKRLSRGQKVQGIAI
jgi:exopolysaccharide production protein ExoZ